MDRAGLEAEVRRLRRELRAAERVRRPAEAAAVQLERSDALRRLADLYDLAPVGYLTLDRDGIIRAVNLTAATLFGRRRRVLVGYPLLRLVAKDHQRRYLAHLAQLRRGEARSTVEVEVLGPGNVPVPVQLVSAASGQEAPARWFPTALVDLTERRAAEEALQRERGLLASVMSATDVMLAYLDREFDFVWVNEAYAKTCGFRAEDMVGRNHFELYPHAENEAIFRRVRDTSEPAFYKDKPFEFPDQPERGTTYWDWSLTPVKAPDGSVTGLVFSLRDTTPFKRAERNLFEANQRLEAVMKAVPVGVGFTEDPSCTHINANPTLLTQFAARAGDEVSASAPDPGALGRRIRYLRDGAGLEVDKLPLRRAVAENREIPPTELEVEMPDGRRWFAEASAAPIYGPDGGVAGAVAVTVDVTARKSSERALRQSEQRYRMLVERSPDAVFVHQRGRVAFANPALVSLLGAGDPQEVVGGEVLNLFHAEDREFVRERIGRVLDGEPVPLAEVRLVRRDGGLREVEAMPTRIETDGGPAVQVILHDVTERRAAQRELEDALALARRNEAERAALLGAARTVLDKPAFGEAAKAILNSCRKVVGGDAGFVAVCGGDVAAARLVHADLGGVEGFTADGVLSATMDLRKRVQATRRTVIANGRGAGRRRRSGADVQQPLDSVLLAPLVVGAEVLGVLGLTDKTGGFSKDDGRLASAFAEMAAVALLNSRTLEVLENNQELLESQVRERTARLAATNALLESERRRFFSLLEELPIFVFLRAEDCSIRFANRYFREHFGDPEGKRCFELLGAGESPCLGCRAADVLATRQGTSWEWTSPAGRTYQVHNYPFAESDGSDLVLEMGIDVTELRQAIRAEQQARRAAETLRASSLALTRTLELDAVLAALLQHLRELVPYDRARVMVLDADAQLVVRASVDALEDGAAPPPEPGPFEPSDNPVLQQVLEGEKAVVIADMHEHPQWGRRMEPTYAHSWLGAPLVARGRVVGLFSLSKHEVGFFGDGHVRLAEALSAQASVAVENALLFEEIQASRGRLQELSRRLVDVQEGERRAIARELHDETGQSLTSLLYGLRVLERDSTEYGPVAERTGELRRTVEEVMENLHRLAANLRPASLDHLGLEAAIQQLLLGIEGTDGLTVRFRAHGLEGERLQGHVETALYRLVQEAVNNVVRHARASAVDVLMERREGKVVVVVEDDGVGFQPGEARAPGQLGLVGMRERAEMLGGNLTVESAPGAGTTVVVEVPCAPPRNES
jgi:PAS domain S-box-containing protein